MYCQKSHQIKTYLAITAVLSFNQQVVNAGDVCLWRSIAYLSCISHDLFFNFYCKAFVVKILPTCLTYQWWWRQCSRRRRIARNSRRKRWSRLLPQKLHDRWHSRSRQSNHRARILNQHSLIICIVYYTSYSIQYYIIVLYYISKSNLIFNFFAIRGYKTVNSRMIKKFKCNETQKSCFNISFTTPWRPFSRIFG